MPRFPTLRLALSIVLLASLPAASFSQSQDSQSVADAARRAREQKKPQPKPAKVITDEDIKPAPQAASATPGSPDAAATQAQSAPANATSAAPAAGTAPAADSKDQKESKEVTDLKAQVKQALADLNLVLREESLEEDKYFSNTDYVHDNAGKAKIDDLKQQAGTRQQELDRLKARLAELLPPPDNSVPPPKQP